MFKIKNLAHTADVALKVEADSLDELFNAGFKSLSDLLKPGYCENCHAFEIWQFIEIESLDITVLLIDFLSDVLTFSYTELSIFCKLEILELQPGLIRANIYGQNVSEFEEDIKAVTYHEAEVMQNDNGNWETRIIFDI